MKSRTRIYTAAAALTITALALTGCSGASDQNDDSAASHSVPNAVDLNGENVVALFTSFNNDYFADIDKGAREAVEAFNGNYLALTNEGDSATQIAQFEQQVSEGSKYFFIITPDQSTVSEIARIAEANDVCIANVWDMEPWSSPFEFGDTYASYQTLDVRKAAYETAVALFEEMGGEGNFVHLTGRPGQHTDTLRTEGVDQALAEYPNVKLLDRQSAPEWSRDSGRNAMAGVISRNGTEIDGVFGQNDDVGIGATNALSEAGLSDVPVTGLDGNAGTLELVESGQMFATYSSFPSWSAGYAIVQAIDACISGEPNPPLLRQVWTGGELVTKENVAEYKETYLGDRTPYDWVAMSRVANPETWDPQHRIEVLDMEEQWSSDPQPSGYSLPEQYTAAWPDASTVNSELDERWKLLRK